MDYSWKAINQAFERRAYEEGNSDQWREKGRYFLNDARNMADEEILSK
jgi:hypothetical protein